MSRLLDFLGKYFDFGRRSKNPENRFPGEAPNVAQIEDVSIFKAPWVLTLQTEVPKIAISGVSMDGLRRKLEDYYSRVQAVVTYFPDGKYLIGCDGSMHLLAEDENARYAEYPQVTAAIDLDMLPYANAIEKRIALSSQKSLMYGNKEEYLLLRACADGMNARKGKSFVDCELRFAARNGAIIVAKL